MSGWQETWTAIGTVGATVVALGLGVVAESRNFRDRSKRRIVAERAQAERVSAWVATGFDYDAASPDADDIEVGWPQAIVENASDQPVWAVTLHGYSIDGTETGADGKERAVRTPWPVQIRVIAPKAREVRHVPSGPVDDDELPSPLVVTFRDGGDRWWKRDDAGRLHRLDGEPAPVPPHRWQRQRG